MDRWTWPAYVGVIGGAVLFVALLLPLVVWQSRRYGRLSVWRMLGAAAVAVYGVALVAYTLLPLPSGDLAAWCAQYAMDGPQLKPFQFVADIRTDTAGMGITATLRSTAVLQVVFNVLLFVPWGVLGRRLLGWGVAATTASACAVSLLIETTQQTGIFGLIGCAYRLGDVDDLMTNTLGGLLGALVAPVVLRWMPRPGDLAATRAQPRPVTVWRRWLGMTIDVVTVWVVGTAATITYRLGQVVTGHDLPESSDVWQQLLGSVLPVVVVLWLPLLAGSGASLGQRAMWLAPRWRDADGRLVRGPLWRRLLRGLAGAGGWGLLTLLGDLTSLGWTGALEVVFVAATVLAVPWTAGHRGLSGVLTGGVLVDAREVSDAPEQVRAVG